MSLLSSTFIKKSTVKYSSVTINYKTAFSKLHQSTFMLNFTSILSLLFFWCKIFLPKKQKLFFYLLRRKEGHWHNFPCLFYSSNDVIFCFIFWNNWFSGVIRNQEKYDGTIFLYNIYRKIVICTRPLFVPAVQVSILNLLSKIGLWECSKFNSTASPNNDFTVIVTSQLKMKSLKVLIPFISYLLK